MNGGWSEPLKILINGIYSTQVLLKARGDKYITSFIFVYHDANNNYEH